VETVLLAAMFAIWHIVNGEARWHFILPSFFSSAIDPERHASQREAIRTAGIAPGRLK
jgi:hypothetical protein